MARADLFAVARIMSAWEGKQTPSVEEAEPGRLLQPRGMQSERDVLHEILR